MTMPNGGRPGLARIMDAGRYSAAGLRAAWSGEAAFRQEVVLTVLLVAPALWLGQTPLQRAALIGCCVLVLVVELLNSAIEAVVDRIGRDVHTLSGRAKDMGSAAVLLSLMLTVMTWAAVAWQRWH